MDDNNLRQLNNLIEMANNIIETAPRKEIPRAMSRRIIPSQTPYLPEFRLVINRELATQWETSSIAFIERIFGSNYSYLDNFKRCNPFSTAERVESGRGVLKSIKTDYETGLFGENNKEQIININAKELGEPRVNIEVTKDNCLKEAERNTKIYLIFIFIVVILLAIALSNIGIAVASWITLGILLIGYILSFIFLKEWTPSKLHERILELEKNRIYKRFRIDAD